MDVRLYAEECPMNARDMPPPAHVQGYSLRPIIRIVLGNWYVAAAALKTMDT